jgi:hypothetical protein
LLGNEEKTIEGAAEFTLVCHPTVLDSLVCHNAIQLINSTTVAQLLHYDVYAHDIVH